MTPERHDHMITQYVWALENDAVFMAKAQYEVERSNFNEFRRLVGRHIIPTRKLLDENTANALSGPEWSFLYLEMWMRLRYGNGKPSIVYPQINEANQKDYDYQLDRLNAAGYMVTSKGVVKRPDMEPCPNQNPCAENLIGEIATCNLEITMNDNNAKCAIGRTINATAFETKSYIFGADVAFMSEEGLIEAIKRVEEQIADLKAVKTKSKKIAENIAKLEAQLKSIVEVLDAR